MKQQVPEAQAAQLWPRRKAARAPPSGAPQSHLCGLWLEEG